MKNYDSLTTSEQRAVEIALDELALQVRPLFSGLQLARDDRAARAAEALATYIVESKEG